jgi:nucleotidyltransferase/DNA polymerase involved in DNA repair
MFNEAAQKPPDCQAKRIEKRQIIFPHSLKCFANAKASREIRNVGKVGHVTESLHNKDEIERLGNCKKIIQNKIKQFFFFPCKSKILYHLLN